MVVDQNSTSSTQALPAHAQIVVIGGAVGMGFVNHPDGVSADFINSGDFEIDIAGQRYPARASLRPMYDPKNERVRS